ncbi:KH domain-containing protein [Akkermansia glycaniphila]|uniref:Kh domain n=1 Tax=Akkermansia glycaniphila TaxID=1679444 RepID=A0A1C7PAQ5_9BACT|nr:KH domain-containing protein [Akkermansia glycaniphila]OCA02660.1 KH domain-containing protein [Akkermansia glycaniphila]SEH77704.1 kh domain [Akkermansia glycaniphila]
MKTVVENVRRYLQLISSQFVRNPELAELRIAEVPESSMVRFRLILDKADIARVIGRNGMTASAIRSLAKAVGEKYGVKVIVHILSHEEAEMV